MTVAHLSAPSSLDTEMLTSKHAAGGWSVCYPEGCSTASLKPPPANSNLACRGVVTLETHVAMQTTL